MNQITSDLFEAARVGSVDDAATAIAFGANINAVNCVGMTPLHYACWRRNVAVVDLLLRMKGILANVYCREGFTPLHLVASTCQPARSEADAVNIVRLLVNSGLVDVNARSARLGETALMTAIACSQSAVAAMLILAPGIDLMARDFKGRNAIDFALAYHDDDTYDLLISTLQHNGDILMFDESVPSVTTTSDPMPVVRRAPGTPYKPSYTPCYPGIHAHLGVPRSTIQ